MARYPGTHPRRGTTPGPCGVILLVGMAGLFSTTAPADEGELTTIRVEGGQWLAPEAEVEPAETRATDPALGTRAVVEAETLKETSPDRVEALTDRLPGAHAGFELGHLETGVTMRGFAVTRPEKDGLPDIHRLFVRDLYTVERVELVTGPDAILSGVSSPGGLIRYTGKRPEFDSAHAFGIETGDPDHRRLTLDSTGPLSERVAYRVVAAAQDGETDPGELSTRRDHAQVGLSWLYGDHGEVYLEHEYQRNQQPYNMGTIITDDGPRYDTTYHAPDQDSDRRYRRTALEWNHDLTSSLAISARAARARVTRDERLIGFFTAGTLPAPDPLWGYAADLEDDYTQDDARVQLTVESGQAKTRHTTVLGADHQTRRIDLRREQSFWDGSNFVYLLDQEDPDFSDVDTDNLPVTALHERPEETRRAGAYLAHRTAGDGWRVTAGLRQNAYETRSADEADAKLETENKGSDTTWQLGSTVRTSEHLEHFGHIGTTVQPNSGRDRDGELLPHRRATQVELGMRVHPNPRQRWEFLYFMTDVRNVAREDEDCDADCLKAAGVDTAYTVEGRLDVRGLETRYDLAAGDWRLHLNYGVQRSRVLDDADDHAGHQFPGVPEYTGGARLAREWRSGGATARLWWGAEHVGERHVDAANEYTVPAYTRHDIGASYHWRDGTRLHLVADNVTDERYIAAPSVQGPRRSVRLGMSRDF